MVEWHRLGEILKFTEGMFISPIQLRKVMRVQQWLCVAILLSLTVPGCIEMQNQDSSDEENKLTAEFTHPWNDTEQCLEHKEDQRCWISHIPSTISEEEGAPLLLDLHGYSLTMHTQKNLTGLTELADDVGAIVIYPQGIHRDGDPVMGGGSPSWNAGTCCADAVVHDIDDSGFLSALIDLAIEELPIDETRVYVTGWSNGCGMAQRLAIESSHQIAAIACTSFYLLYDLQPEYVPIPILEIHGVIDEHALYATSSRSVIFNPAMQDDTNSLTTGAVQNMMRWAEHNNCENSIPDINIPGSLMTTTGFSNCEGGAEVQLISVHQGGHNLYSNDWGEPTAWPYYIPGNQGLYDTGQIMWDFLSRFTNEQA